MHDQAAGHHAAQGAALRILEARPHEGRERRLVEHARAVLIDLGHRVLVGERDVDGIVVAGHAGGGRASHGVAGLFGDARAQAQLGGDGGVLGIGHVVGPQRAALVGILVPQAANLLAFRRRRPRALLSRGRRTAGSAGRWSAADSRRPRERSSTRTGRCW